MVIDAFGPLALAYFILCLTVWGVEPDVTHQTSWLGSTGECGVPQNQVDELKARSTPTLRSTNTFWLAARTGGKFISRPTGPPLTAPLRPAAYSYKSHWCNLILAGTSSSYPMHALLASHRVGPVYYVKI